MDVQAAQWSAQLNRMVSLCMQEAAEYERGRTLQVLQPSLASLLQPSQRPLVAAANAQNAGQQSASGPTHSATPSKPQEQGVSGISISQAAAADGSSVQAGATIKQEDQATAQPQQTPAASKPAASDAAAVTVPFCTPMATLAGAPSTGLLSSQTPLGVQQQDGTLAMPASAGAPAAAMLSGGLSNQQMLACNGVLHLPLQQQQQQQQQRKSGDITPAAVAAAHVTPQQFHLACPGVDAAATPALLLPALGNPLMQHMLMQQAQQQQFAQQQQQQPLSPGVFAPVITTTQPNSRKGKRRGYSIQPEALKALVARQMQAKQQPKSEQEQEQQDPQPQQDQQQMQPPTGLQQQQLGARLQPQQQHRQRSMPRVPPALRQHAGASLDAAAADNSLAAAAAAEEEDSPGSAVAGLLPLQLPMSLESPGAACLGLKMTCAEELEQPGVQLELDTAKLFGSAQKRLRLSICDEPHLHAARNSLAGHQQDQLTAALISPVAVPVAAAVARDAAVAARPPAGATAAAAAEPHTSVELPHVGLVTPSKFFAGSPVATLGGAATRGSATGVTADVPQPVFATPSKFFSGSPVADDAAFKRGGLQETEPETPLLFGHGAASPWPPRQLAMELQPPAVCGSNAAAAAAAAGSSSSVLRSSGGAGMAASNRQDASGAAGAAQQSMSWVPVGGHASQAVGLMAAAHDPAGLAATPAGAAVKLGLLCTPMAAGQGGGDDGGVLDAAAAAAAPVDCLPVKGAVAAVAAEAAQAAEGDAAAAGAAAVPAGMSLTTPAGQEQQVLATPVTGV